MEISLSEITSKAVNVTEASIKWRAAGMPMRTPDVIESFFAECKSNRCKKYANIGPGHGQCIECGCNVSKEFSSWNKIALATEVCPLGLWPKPLDTAISTLTTPYRTPHNSDQGCCGGTQSSAPTTDVCGMGGELIAKFNEYSLAPGIPGMRFNSSIIEHPYTKGDYLLAYRNGWAGSQIFLHCLNQDFKPYGDSWQLDLFHHLEASYGREDPRLFMHNDRIHIAYAGVVSGASQLHTSVLFARLTEDCSKVEDKWYPFFPQRNSWEKNWGFFSHDKSLYAVYSVHPHRILKMENHNFAVMEYSTPNNMVWHGAELRGGSAPVLVGDEWWHFVHDRIVVNGLRVYRTSLYTFKNEPPFRVLRYIESPILIADPRSKPLNQYCAAIFTCGAVKVGDDWILSSGANDRWTELHRFKHAELEKLLKPIE